MSANEKFRTAKKVVIIGTAITLSVVAVATYSPIAVSAEVSRNNVITVANKATPTATPTASPIVYKTYKKLPEVKGTKQQPSFFEVKVAEKTSSYVIFAPKFETTPPRTVLYSIYDVQKKEQVSDWTENPKFEGEWGRDVWVKCARLGDDIYRTETCLAQTTLLKQSQETPVKLEGKINDNGELELSVSGGDSAGGYYVKMVTKFNINDNHSYSKLEEFLKQYNDPHLGYKRMYQGYVEDKYEARFIAARKGDDFYEDSPESNVLYLKDLLKR